MAEILEGAIEMFREDDGRVVITKTPPVVRMTLECLQQFDPYLMRISGKQITFAGKVTYRVIGWDDAFGCLIMERRTGGV